MRFHPKTSLSLFTLSLLALCAAPRIQAQRRYVITRKLAYDYNSVNRVPFGLNNYGDISGASYSTPEINATVYKFTGEEYVADYNTGYTNPPCIAYGVNDAGTIAITKQLYVNTNDFRAIFNPGTGGKTASVALPALYGSDVYSDASDKFAQAFGINNAGQLVGMSLSRYRFPDGYPAYHATLWENGQAVDMDGRTAGYVNSVAQAINSKGLAVGYAWLPFGSSAEDSRIGTYAFQWSKASGLQSLGTPYVGYDPVFNETYYVGTSDAFAISEDGKIVGDLGGIQFDNKAISHAFYFDGLMRDLGGFPGNTDTRAVGVNSRGQVVGWAYGDPTIDESYRQGYSGFVWENSVMRDLSTLVANSTLHWHPVGINERGEIAASVDERYANISGALLTPEAVEITSQVRVASSGLTYNRASQTYNGTVTITNTGSKPVYGPLQVQINGLTGGATLANQSGLHNGAPFIYFNNVIQLAPGASASVPVQFRYSGAARLGYAVTVYSGAFAF